MSYQPTPEPWSRTASEAIPGQIPQPLPPTHTGAPYGYAHQPPAAQGAVLPPPMMREEPSRTAQAGDPQGSQPVPPLYAPPAHLDEQPSTQGFDPPVGAPWPVGSTTGTLSQPQSAARDTGHKGSTVVGLVALAVLAGGIGGGAAGYTTARYLSPVQPGSSVTQTKVVQADPANPNWAVTAAAASRSVVAIHVAGAGGEGQGSGVIIDAQGHIVTNNHVVAGSGANPTITVLLDNTSYAATVVGTDPATDLAVLALTDPPTDLSVIGFADSDALAVGDPVMAIGNPLGLDNTVTTGIVSALNRPVTTRAVTNSPVSQQGDVVVTAAIQTSAAINPGNSGGALVNQAGELVGITSSIATLSSSGDSQSGNIGIGFAIASQQVRHVVDQLITRGYAEHPQIGVNASDVTGTGQLGARLVRVSAGSPAETAGLRVGDLITAVDGKPVASTESLVALVRAGEVGKPMELTVVRDATTQTITVVPTAAPR